MPSRAITTLPARKETPISQAITSIWQPANGNLTKQIGRLDYNITPKNRIDFSIIEHYTPVVISTDSPNCPVNCQYNSLDGGNGQLSDVWTISANLVNEVAFFVYPAGGLLCSSVPGQGYPGQGWIEVLYRGCPADDKYQGTGGQLDYSTRLGVAFHREQLRCLGFAHLDKRQAYPALWRRAADGAKQLDSMGRH